MRFADAYKKLGYKLDNHQTDWSAEKADGVCISIWKKLACWKPPPPYFDCSEVWPDEEPGADQIGHKKRRRHVQRAFEELHGFVDAVLLSGTYGEGYDDAEPCERPGGRWKITRFDPSNGKFRAEVVVQGKEGN